MNTGTQRQDDGVTQINTGTQRLDDGVTQMNTGTQRHDDGWSHTDEHWTKCTETP